MKNISAETVSSVLPLPLAGFEAILEKIVNSSELEREWVDLLSHLEYIGCRKILKAVPFAEVNVDVLRHISEEASHAYLLKAAIERSGLPARSWGSGPLTQAGWSYFQELDHTVSALQKEERAYPVVSWIVEQRVLAVYPIYLAATRNPQVKRALTTILAQEQRHSAQFEALGFSEALRAEARAIEAPLWERFLRDVQAALPALARESECSPSYTH